MFFQHYGDEKKYIQVKPFTFGKMFSGEVLIEERGNIALFFSVETKMCLGVSDICTKKLFKEVKEEM